MLKAGSSETLRVIIYDVPEVVFEIEVKQNEVREKWRWGIGDGDASE